LPTDPRALVGLLIDALARQHNNYVELRSAVEAMVNHLERRAPDGEFATVDASEESETNGGFQEVEAALDPLLERQADALRRSDEEDRRIHSIRRSISHELDIPEVDVTSLRSALASRGYAGADDLIDSLKRKLHEAASEAERVRAMSVQNEAKLRAHITAIKGELSGVQRGQQATRAYGDIAKGLERPSRFLDKKK